MHLIASPPQYSTLGTGNRASFGIHSPLSGLPLHSFTVTAECCFQVVIEHFMQFSDLPGVIVTDGDTVTMFSRQACLDCLLHIAKAPYFLESPIRVVLSQRWQGSSTGSVRQPLMLASDVTILAGAQRALRRPHQQQFDPILVTHEETYHLLDARTLNVAHWQIRGIETQVRYERLQMQILESEKMASLGRLVDGVAHEILDPVSFIWGNLSYIASYTQQQYDLLMAYESALPDADAPPEILALKEDIELDYLRSDLPAAVKSARGGAHRLRQLATSLQNFCHIDAVHPRPTDLNALIDSTLRLLKSRLTTPISIEHSYGKLPPVPCFSGQLSQVFMSIFTHTIDALLSQVQGCEEASEASDANSLQITVTTCICADQHGPKGSPEASRWVSIIISDNGPGIPPDTKKHILDSFSTGNRYRKEKGLAMSYQIITAKHGGKFWLRSLHALDQDGGTAQTTGTEFEILLPLTTGE